MDSDQKFQFNSQVIRTNVAEPAQPPSQTHSEPNIDPQRELLVLIRDENSDGLRDFLSSQPNAETLVNQRDREFHQTPLYIATQTPNRQSALAICRVLVQFGANFKVKDVHGQSPLFYICKDGNIPLLQLALSNGAEINEVDNFKQTPLFYAARDGQG